MKNGVSWYFDDFTTFIDGIEYIILCRPHYDGFIAEAYFAQCPITDDWCNSVESDKSGEDAILKLVKLLEE